MGSGEDAEDVVFADEGVFLFVDFDFGAAVFADEDFVADLDFEGRDFAVLVFFAGAECDDFGLLGLFLCGVRDDDATADLFFFFDVLHEDAITDGLDFYFGHIGFVLWLVVVVGGKKVGSKSYDGWECCFLSADVADLRR